MSEQENKTISKEELVQALVKLFPTESQIDQKKIKDKIEADFDKVYIEELDKAKIVEISKFLSNIFEMKNLKEYKDIYLESFTKASYREQIDKLVAILDPLLSLDYLLGFLINRRFIPKIFSLKFEYLIIQYEIFEIVKQFEEAKKDFPEEMLGFAIDKLIQKAFQNECYAHKVPYRYFEDTLNFFAENIYWITARTDNVKDPEELIIIDDFLSFTITCEKITNRIHHEIKLFLATCQTPEYQTHAIPLPEFVRSVDGIKSLLAEVEPTRELFVHEEVEEQQEPQDISQKN